jgi:hypothetical protein
MLFVPFVYGFFAFLAIAASCALYNFLTPYVGGIEFES